jgi:hypothetical protein
MSIPLAALLSRDGRSSRSPPHASRRTRVRPADRERAGQRLYEITIPRLSIETDFAAVRQRLLADFSGVIEVLAMSTPGTMLIVYEGEDEVDSWCEALDDAVAARQRSWPRDGEMGKRTMGAAGFEPATSRV